jgi:hypothetical protein
MAITNRPYNDEKIVAAVQSLEGKVEQVRDVQVNFMSNDTSPEATAVVTAVFSWTIPAAEAARILDQAQSGAAEPQE